MADKDQLIAQLQARILSLENEVRSARSEPARAPVTGEFSAEVVDENPYSRLMALQRMGIVENYNEIRTFSVMIVGVGGVGSVAAEMLTRCGIGKLLLFDFDLVTMANMNRLFFTPNQVGKSKVEAARDSLTAINPDVVIDAYSFNICHIDRYEQFCGLVQNGGLGGKPVDMILSCVDNYDARGTINKVCCALNRSWMESGVSENAVSSHIQFLVPGRNACFLCAMPLKMLSGPAIKREGVCAASLPTTMGITAALLVQNCLKYLLKFGKVSYFLGYNALEDYFPTYPLEPNPECVVSECLQRQREAREQNLPPLSRCVERQVVEAPVNLTNEWGIVLVPDDEPSATAAPPTPSPPTNQPQMAATTPEVPGGLCSEVVNTGDKSLSQLMAELKLSRKS
eukprot:gnl/Spiro4/4439_TR2206_c0_g1_i1.p1 gnl/Spiro4/4439_TR2206_c0_g1~~gnl/Spiro4/4439_TR2206_c0_g1_i1.p1  ORF type:complete len:416 (+),score=98.00 gnl/Spiro4/4439_TR2206_c0_g1_i1:56-1249(+)